MSLSSRVTHYLAGSTPFRRRPGRGPMVRAIDSGAMGCGGLSPSPAVADYAGSRDAEQRDDTRFWDGFRCECIATVAYIYENHYRVSATIGGGLRVLTEVAVRADT